MIPVCRNFFKWTFQISSDFLDQPTLPKGPFSVEMRGPRVAGRMNDLSATACIVEWLEDFGSFHLYDPRKQHVILLVGSKKQVYDNYVADFAKENKKHFFPQKNNVHYVPSFQFFCRVWATDPRTQQFKLRQYLCFTLCDQCVYFINQRRVVNSVADRQLLRKLEKDHHAFICNERDSYYLRRLKALTEPNKYLSIIIDGSDQAAFGLPHIIDKDKKTASQHKIPLHLMGALVHGRSTYGFTYLNNVKHGTNIVIECLHRIINDMPELPETLFLQLDNTWKQNKNQFMIGFAGCLVQWGIFKRVVVSFLPVGHTHEDIGTK